MIDRACISMSNECNMSCHYCHFSGKAINEYVVPETLLTIVDNITEYINTNKVDSFKIGLVGAGEPLLQFDLLKNIILYAESRSNSIKFYTISNGLSIHDEMLEFFRDHVDSVKLSFSLDGYRTLHDMNRVTLCGNGSFSTVMKSISRYNDFLGTSPEINCTVHRYTINNKEETFDFFLRNRLDRVNFSRIVDVEGTELEINQTEFESFLTDAASAGLKSRQMSSSISADCMMYGKYCGVGRNNIFYFGNRVYPCGRFLGRNEYVIGHSAEPLERIENRIRNMTSCSSKKCYFETLVKKRPARNNVITPNVMERLS